MRNSLVGGIVAPHIVAIIEDRILNLEKLGDVREFIGVLGRPVSLAF